MNSLIRVLVVDDSAFVRKVVAQMLSRSPFIEVVGTARDGEEALEMAARLEPDVVTLDLVMPRMDGLEFLKRQMSVRPVPVVICSISHESGRRRSRHSSAAPWSSCRNPPRWRPTACSRWARN
jgi:Chemotaxis response regulator containing a CheY-like receiver domain and a methylesterase domain